MLLIFLFTGIKMKKFKKIYIEITNICNLNCSFCPKHKRTPKIMSPSEFEKILQITHNRGDNFYLHLMGEPTSHPEFKEILNICNKYNIKINITTNGTLLNNVDNLLLESNLRSVNISLHSFEANNLNISLQDYLDNIISFCKKAIGQNTVVELRLWTMSIESIKNKDSINHKIVEYINKNLNPNIDMFKKLEETFFYMTNNRKKNFKIYENIFLGMSEQFSWPSIQNSPNKVCSGFCYGLRNQIAILSDGTVVPCCLDSDGNIPLGNIFKEDFDSIINSSRSKNIYNGFTNQKAVEPLCQSCGYMKKYMEIKYNNSVK